MYDVTRRLKSGGRSPMERCWLEWTRWPVSPLLCTVGSWKAIMRPNCRTMMSTGSLSVAAELFVYTYNIGKLYSYPQ